MSYFNAVKFTKKIIVVCFPSFNEEKPNKAKKQLK
jgi:hypothetical protein